MELMSGKAYPLVHTGSKTGMHSGTGTAQLIVRRKHCGRHSQRCLEVEGTAEETVETQGVRYLDPLHSLPLTPPCPWVNRISERQSRRMGGTFGIRAAV